jgi:hypothetical protein
MKIIITEGQVDLIKEKTNKSAKLLGKFYDIEADGAYYLGDGMIQSRVRFTPKDFDNPMTPQYGESVCNWKIDKPFSSIPGENITFADMTLPDSFNVPLMDHIGNTEELEKYLKGLHMEEVEEFIKRIIERRNNPLNESVDKNKKFLTNVMGQDFTNNIKQITSAYNVPYNFYRKGTISLRTIMSYLNSFGPMYLFELDGKKYLYQDRFDKDWFIDEDGHRYINNEISEKLGIDVMGLRFSDIIDMFINDEEPLNEENNMPEENTKIKNLLKKVLENRDLEYSFTDTAWDDNRVTEKYTIEYHIKVGEVFGSGSDAVAGIDVIIDKILLNDEDFYYDWVDSGYSENAWYIDYLLNELYTEVLSDFPFSIYPTVYGYDEEI